MDLKALAAAAGTVETSNGTRIAVRGLSLVDLSQLARAHGKQLAGAFDAFKGMEANENDDATATLHQLIERAPDLVAEVIALATDSPGEAAAAKQLPFGLQVAILNETGKQTFVTEGGLGKTLEIVINMAAGTTRAIADLQTPKA
jgi:hypothetical protein